MKEKVIDSPVDTPTTPIETDVDTEMVLMSKKTAINYSSRCPKGWGANTIDKPRHPLQNVLY